MNQKIQQLLDDLHRVTSIVTTVQAELQRLHVTRQCQREFLLLKEQLEEVHVRLEGARDFIVAAREQANRPSAEAEELDFWL